MIKYIKRELWLKVFRLGLSDGWIPQCPCLAARQLSTCHISWIKEPEWQIWQQISLCLKPLISLPGGRQNLEEQLPEKLSGGRIWSKLPWSCRRSPLLQRCSVHRSRKIPPADTLSVLCCAWFKMNSQNNAWICLSQHIVSATLWLEMLLSRNDVPFVTQVHSSPPVRRSYSARRHCPLLGCPFLIPASIAGRSGIYQDTQCKFFPFHSLSQALNSIKDSCLF